MSDLEIKQSAYKHGHTYDDIINCYRYPIAIRVVDADSSKYLYVGFDMKGNPMEILANHNGISVIFHAMKLRKEFEKMLSGKKR
jgi:hypothetical protein